MGDAYLVLVIHEKLHDAVTSQALGWCRERLDLPLSPGRHVAVDRSDAQSRRLHERGGRM